MSKSINATPFDAYIGNTRKVALPTPGVSVTIREHTGEDEDTLTRVKNQEDGTAIAEFLSRVVIEPIFTPEQIQKWRIRDKYFLLFEVMR